MSLSTGTAKDWTRLSQSKKQLSALYEQKIASECPELHIARQHHRNSFNQAMVFNKPGRKWMIPIYADKSPKIVVCKSVQCGITEWLIIKKISLLQKGYSVFYVLPTDDICAKFVHNRINPLFEDIEFYRAARKATDNVRLKKLWDGTVTYTGSQSRAAFREFPAQAYIVDEVDLCDLVNLQYGLDRLAAAKSMGIDPVMVYVSNPTIAGYGIDAEYQKSDKKTWQIKCSHCNEWQEIDWFKNIVRQTDDNRYELRKAESVVCFHCGGELDRLSDGAWVAEFPDRDVSGYHISKLITDQTTIRELFNQFQEAQSNQAKLQHFYNSELGLPFTGGDSKFEYSDLSKLAGTYRMPHSAKHTIAGIDVGKVFNMIIWQLENGIARTVYIGAPATPEETVRTLQRYGVHRYAIDAQPETHLAKKVLELFPGGALVWIQGETSKGSTTPKVNEINVNRTEFLDAMVANHYAGYVELPMDWATVDDGDYLAQMTAPTRVIKEKTVNGVKRPVYVWDEGGRPDHYFLASAMVNKISEMIGFFDEQWGGIWG